MVIPRSVSDFFAREFRGMPCPVVSLAKAEANDRAPVEAMPFALHHDAINADTHPEIPARLVEFGGRLECAGVTDIEACIAAGARAGNVRYGNPLNKAREIPAAHSLAVRQCVFDAELAREKIAAPGPGAQVICRIVNDGHGAVSPVSKKSGCPAVKAEQRLPQAVGFALLPFRVSFHTRSRPLESASAGKPTADTAAIFARLEQHGTTTTRVVDMGSRFPVDCGQTCDTGPVILADQTCDSNDGIYPASCGYELPIALKPGDRVVPTHTGAYTTTSSANLNGYPLLSSLCI
jgi:ornithine decarboxylase